VSRDAAAINPLTISRFAHEGVISKMEISRDGRLLVSASESGVVKVWDAAQVIELTAVRMPTGNVVTSLAIDIAGRKCRVALSSGETQVLELPDLSAASEAAVPMLSTATVISTAPVGEPVAVTEAEPNNELDSAQPVPYPAAIAGLIDTGSSIGVDQDVFKFQATQGQPVLLEVKAARDGSPLDSLLQVLTTDGKPVLQAQLQAVRDSYFTFRGKDSDTSDDFRLFNWQEMELNEYLYADGEVVKLWLYPRGPDSGFKVYPGFGNRETWFGTTATSHPLQGPAFVVVPYQPDAQLRDTGLPVFPVYFENDDDSMRQWGPDSRILFTPPTDGEFLARISDARGAQGADYKYQLLIRAPQPDFTMAVSGTEISIHGGTGRELSFTATRLDGYAGPIEIFAENLPPGFTLSAPILIQDEQRQAFATLIAAPDVTQPSDEAVAAVKLKARAVIGEREVVHDIGGLKALKVVEKPKVTVTILTPESHAAGSSEHVPELIAYAGETTRAFLRVQRHDHAGLVEFGKEDSGRNLPHGVFVDNIGLNGLMLLENQNEREFFITVAPWVPESSRPFFLKSTVDGITSLPVMLHVRHRAAD
jgi:hypothetical protein